MEKNEQGCVPAWEIADPKRACLKGRLCQVPQFKPTLILVLLILTNTLNYGLIPVFASNALEPIYIAQMLQLDQDNESPVFEKEKNASKNSHASTLNATPLMSWVEPGAKPKAAILCVHGLGLHKGSYTQFGERMAKEGFAVYSVDVRGFGSFLEMPGERHCDFPHCLEDVRDALALVHKTHPQLPVFLLGESMGGAIALRVTAMHPELVDGLVSSVPAAERYGQTKNAIKVGLNLIAHPNKEMNVTDVVVNQSTKKAELREEWSKDPLARFQLSPIELMQFQRFMEANEKSSQLITKTPVLMVQGGSDALVRHEANINIVNKIPSKDSQLIFVEHGEHLIFEEGQFDDNVIDTLTAWLTEHLPKSTADPNN